MCKPIEVEHLKYNYGEAKQAEEKKRRITLVRKFNQKFDVLESRMLNHVLSLDFLRTATWNKMLK